MEFLGAEVAEQRISAALDAIDAAHQVLRETSSDLVGNEFRVQVAERLETQERVNRGLMYRFFGEIAEPPDGAESVPAVRELLWARLRLTPGELRRRFRLAARIRPRRSLTAPHWPPNYRSWPRRCRPARSARTTSARCARRWTCCPRLWRRPRSPRPNAPWSTTRESSIPQ